MYDDVSSYHSHSLGNLSTVILTRTNAVFLFSLHAAQAVILIFICCTSYIFKLLSYTVRGQGLAPLALGSAQPDPKWGQGRARISVCWPEPHRVRAKPPDLARTWPEPGLTRPDSLSITVVVVLIIIITNVTISRYFNLSTVLVQE